MVLTNKYNIIQLTKIINNLMYLLDNELQFLKEKLALVYNRD